MTQDAFYMVWVQVQMPGLEGKFHILKDSLYDSAR